jgi:hypothetical protein
VALLEVMETLRGCALWDVFRSLRGHLEGACGTPAFSSFSLSFPGNEVSRLTMPCATAIYDVLLPFCAASPQVQKLKANQLEPLKYPFWLSQLVISIICYGDESCLANGDKMEDSTEKKSLGESERFTLDQRGLKYNQFCLESKTYELCQLH